MRILFAGTPALAVPSLQRAASAHEVAAVLTSPDAPAGRNRLTASPPVKETARALGIEVLQPVTLDDAFCARVRDMRPDLLVVAAYGRIFRKTFLDLFAMGGINLHPSLLPRYRGPSPITAAILAGDAVTGITVQKIALRFDTGNLLAQETHSLRGDETTASLTDELSAQGARLVERVLADIAAGGMPEGMAQEDSAATYCTTIRKEDGVIAWEQPAETIERKVRAFDPWPRASTILAGETLLLLKSHVYPDTLPEKQAVPGEVLSPDAAHGILVRTGQGILAVERLQLQFRKPTDWRSFLNGRPGMPGMRLGA
jgi:methionyl-tRNA formyltransferase